MNPISKLFVTLRGVANHPLQRDHKLRAVVGFCVAQVAARLSPGDICVEFPNQTHVLLSPRMKGAAHFIAPRLCEFEEMAFVMHYLRADDLFVDVGANVGVYTVLAAGVVGARAMAFEPSPDTFEMLSRNIRLNDLADRVKAFNMAVGRVAGTMQLTVGLGTENFINPRSSEGNSVSVKVTTLDARFADTAPNFLKIDVEGFEAEVFAGAKSTLKNKKLRALIVERCNNSNRYGFDETVLHREIRQEGFVPCIYEPFTRSLRQADDEMNGNIIYVRNIPDANAVLRSAPAFKMGNQSI